MPHIILVGDSIFDNAAYVGENNPDVITQLQNVLPETWQGTLNAVDGHKVEDINSQLGKLPKDATHLILSVGGNDSLSSINILDEKVDSSAQVFDQLAKLREEFEQQYQELLKTILGFHLSTTICTIYNPNFADKMLQKRSMTALTIFNDVILTQGFKLGLPIIDLRLVFNESQDYANPIEPSMQGGQKLVNVILNVIENYDFNQQYTRIFY
ncbi:SGNH/GDSL hydrolase family protein [Crocosphaera chwakensis]|uniref:GDSL-lilke lipase/acylhydrolase family protein n=1 Tax=Crocosphaera chwakensis CCY0110 TaxID=391612 RepID=A3IGT7_9CHRO|nr:SGNH/GDSL hydrolase family protein [Crocosphaera chwakensis]EAZ94179.1 GDSL-lilke lipase/acylhydrolase family protein [Crocosphaera chwakensis CCY0110]